MTRRNKIKELIKSQNGSAILVTVLILASLLIIAMNASTAAMSGLVLTGVQEKSTLAFFAAESGAERSMYDSRYGAGLPLSGATNMFGTTTLANGSYYLIDYATDTASSTYSCDGYYKDVKRSVSLFQSH